ncbi:MAG: glycosyltransferase family 4 protein [Candidatus Nealsonbacteria bacterium]|nr:glycosyltransferase family 4 protein [Candidatus Nealsonbacteria bacterium]
MTLLYITNSRIPTEKAHGIQVMKMCEALAKESNVELVVPERYNWIKERPFDYYGIAETFRIKKLPCLDLIRFHKHIGHFGLWLEGLTFFFPALIYIIFKKADIIYSRDKFLLPFSFFKKNIIFEAHTFPKRYFLYFPFLKKLKGMVVITHGLKNLFVKNGISPEKILVAPDGVDLTKFEIRSTKSETRRMLNLPLDKKIVLYAGHLYEWKGVQTLSEASQYLPENVDVYFVGGTKEDVEKFKIKNLNVVGHRPYPEIPLWLQAADVLVLPNSGKEEISRKWTSPLKMFEYMASGIPIVASDLPSIREVLNEDNAVLVEPDSPEKLAEGIKIVLQDHNLSDKILAKAFEDVKEFTWQKRAQKIYENCFLEKNKK